MESIQISIDQHLLDWLDEKIEKNIFASRSHGVRYCIERIREKEAKEWKE